MNFLVKIRFFTFQLFFTSILPKILFPELFSNAEHESEDLNPKEPSFRPPGCDIDLKIGRNLTAKPNIVFESGFCIRVQHVLISKENL